MRKMFLMFALCAASKSYGAFDLNPALLSCIMSGGDCLKSIPIIGETLDKILFKGADTYHTSESFCYEYLIKGFCNGPTGYPSAYSECRTAKKEFYKRSKQKLGEWPTEEQFTAKYPPGEWRPKSREEIYFDEIERRETYTPYGQPQKPPFFSCTSRQEYIFLKAKCEGTTSWNQWIGHVILRNYKYDWDKIPMTICKKKND